VPRFNLPFAAVIFFAFLVSLGHSVAAQTKQPANTKVAEADLCGLPADGKTHLPSQYSTLPMPEIGESNGVVDAQYGCPIWKVAEMSVHDAGPTPIDSKDRWIITKGATFGDPANWFIKSGTFVRDLHTGAIVCTPKISGAGGWIWGAANRVLDKRTKWNDLDTLYFHINGTSQLLRLNVPACIAEGGTAVGTDRAVRIYDDLKDPITGRELYRNLTFCQDASDFSADGDHICVGNNNGGDLQDPRIYEVSTKSVGRSVHGSPNQPPGCLTSPAKGDCYRGAFVAPLTNNLLLAYYTRNGLTPLDLFDRKTGHYIRTVTLYNSHGTRASFNGEEYIVNEVNTGDPQRPPGCGPGVQSIKVNNGLRSCILNKAKTGPGGTVDYADMDANGRATDGGNPYVAVDYIDYSAGYRMNHYAFAHLPRPATPQSGYTVVLTDAREAGSCSSGGGTSRAYCRWNAAARDWLPLSTASYPLACDWQQRWGQYSNEILLVFLDGSPVRHMVHHRSITVETSYGSEKTSGYWSSPRVVISRSGKYMAWDSTWGINNNISVYVAKIKKSSKRDPTSLE
jgi:hypothetical protein